MGLILFQIKHLCEFWSCSRSVCPLAPCHKCVRPESQISVICLQQSQRQTDGDKEAEEQEEGSRVFSQNWVYVLLIINMPVSRMIYKNWPAKKEPKMKYINKWQSKVEKVGGLCRWSELNSIHKDRSAEANCIIPPIKTCTACN